ncbi:efflux RND transporter periplasmic adaptor subunit [Parasphingorhabdus sp.]|uniref:efflux RND transporter periplasmic adaptor subunit n=1 Tax=Parasphingorhabdus sp. TaxID=2709688 RepID=UPI003A91E97E
MPFFRPAISALLLAACAMLAACSNDQADEGSAQGPPEVSVITIAEQPVTLTTELPGRITAYEVSEVRPQVSGLITRRLFTEGQSVKRGQPLYRIDAQPQRAQVASAKAALARARASIAASEALAKRYGELVEINAVSRQDYDDAVAAAGQARADVAAQRAALQSAEIDLARTTIRAPISGRIGRSLVTTGALVSASQATALTTIQKIDPVFVDISQTSAEILKLRQRIAEGDLTRGDGAAAVELILEDGSIYPAEGRLQFTDVSVDPETGSQTIRALFPNKSNLLLPGMFARARLIEGSQSDGILVPQRAVSRDDTGAAVVMVVGPGGKLMPRTLVLGQVIGQDWLVKSGLKPGDKVVIEGAMMLRPGMPVKAVPWKDPSKKPLAGASSAPSTAQSKK